MNGKDMYLQSVQQNGPPVLKETSNRDEATKFKVAGDKDQRFQLTDLPGGSTYQQSLKDGKTYLITSNAKYVKLGRDRVEETENIDQCLEVAAWGWFACEEEGRGKKEGINVSSTT